MTQSTFKDKYPLFSYTLNKADTAHKDVNAIIAYYKEKIEAHPIAIYIATFDHFSHTTSLNGTINPDIKDLQNIIFCFGAEIPSAKVGAVRPRSISVCDLGDTFTIDFMEAPNPKANEFMINWTKSLT